MGATLRYGLGMAISSRVSPAFPAGTFCINLIGSFLIGLLDLLFSAHTGANLERRAMLITGVLGGFTTFSTYEFESLELARLKSRKWLTVNLFGSFVIGLLGVAAGHALGVLVTG